MNDLQLDSLIDDCINDLSDDNIKTGVSSLVELARVWARAGMSQADFYEMRRFIINSAIQKTDALFIAEKLKIHEGDAKLERCSKKTTH